jgi:hypothetical protein
VSALNFKFQLLIFNQNFAKFLGELPPLEFKSCQSRQQLEILFRSARKCLLLHRRQPYGARTCCRGRLRKRGHFVAL